MTADAPDKILYVEDDPDIQDVAKIALSTIGGFTLKVCSSGTEALGVAEAFSPDLIVLDVMMPGLDGPETLAKLRKLPNLTQTPVVFVTGMAMPEDIGRYKALGAVDVITKPFNPMFLATQIKAIWETSHGR